MKTMMTLVGALFLVAAGSPSPAVNSSDECGVANVPGPRRLLRAPSPRAEPTGIWVYPGDKLLLDLQACEDIGNGMKICARADSAYHVLAINDVPQEGWLFGYNMVRGALGDDPTAREVCQDWIAARSR